MDVLALLAVGVIVALWWLVGRDDKNYEIRRGWRLPEEKRWK
jgi:uncharacterized membrane protein YsdA (DUF1294 family)